MPGAVEVGVDDRVPAVRRDIGGMRRKLASGVVDEDVQAAVALPDRCPECADLLRARMVIAFQKTSLLVNARSFAAQW